MSSNTLQNYYQTIFSLVTHYGYSINEIEDIYPFERDIYVTMLNTWIEEKKREQGKSNMGSDFDDYIRSFSSQEMTAQQNIQKNNKYQQKEKST